MLVFLVLLVLFMPADKQRTSEATQCAIRALLVSAIVIQPHFAVATLVVVVLTAKTIEHFYPQASDITTPVYESARDALLFSPAPLVSQMPLRHYAVITPPVLTAVACGINYVYPGTLIKNICSGAMDTTSYFLGCALLKGQPPQTVLIPAIRGSVCVMKDVVKAVVLVGAPPPLQDSLYKCAGVTVEYSVKATLHDSMSRGALFAVSGAVNGAVKGLVLAVQGHNVTASKLCALISFTSFRVYLHSLPGSPFNEDYAPTTWVKESVLRTAADAGLGEKAIAIIESGPAWMVNGSMPLPGTHAPLPNELPDL